MALQNYQGGDQSFQLMQSTWSAQLNPVLALPILSGVQLENIYLSSASAVAINHKLGRMQQGWIITDQNARANLYRTVPFNSKTLTLSTDADVTVSLWVY